MPTCSMRDRKALERAGPLEHQKAPVAAGGGGALSYLSSILGELKVNLWDHIGIVVPQKG